MGPMASTDPAMPPRSDAQVIDSWHTNAAAWTRVVREGRIESRRQVTDAAIVQAVLGRRPRTVLDLGCGEGWLVRALAGHGIAGTGVDAVAALVEQAQQAGGGAFRVLSYEAIAEGALAARADVVVANFSLLGGPAVERVLRQVPALLEPGGALVVQTLHPVAACGDLPYEEGWRDGTWAGFGEEFTNPAPWYFRTVGGWLALLGRAGMRVVELREPLHPATGKPASIVFVAQ
jgi:2-polyprenyl-3-methyl-5-hydroxy-6-metoxy-1,4-benzoquinol methylase